MSTSDNAKNPTDMLNNIMTMDEEFVSYMILGFTITILICMLLYLIYTLKLKKSECRDGLTAYFFLSQKQKW